MSEQKKPSNATTTPPVRLSFPALFTPRAFDEGQDPKYSVVLMFNKADPAHVECIKKLHRDAQVAFNTKWPPAADGTPNAKAPRIPIAGHDKSPIKDGDKNCDSQGVPYAEKNPEYVGHWIIRCATKTKPHIVDRQRQEILDKSVIYGGCYAKVNINPFAFEGPQNKGVAFGLNGVQFWSDGDSFGSRPRVDEMFDASNADDPSSYDDNPFG